MDTSETYRKMADCEEMRRLSPECFAKEAVREFVGGATPKNRDVYVTRSGNYVTTMVEEQNVKFIWLPTQDQLQEMVDKYNLRNKIIGFYGTCVGSMIHWTGFNFILFDNMAGGEPLLDKFTSMEQLWLAFVMQEKYNKTWDSEKWI